ncbi:MAG: DUF58 domain-containing protein [Gammaproteobacteria bacterium]|nr:DUF58 domain-containing protein [Gammaproteobacteria bacterium]
MIPDRRMLLLLWLLSTVGLSVCLWPQWEDLWWFVFAVIMVVSVADALLTLRPTGLVIQRKIEDSLSLGRWCSVVLDIANQGRRNLQLALYDHHPETVLGRGLPLTLRLDSGQGIAVDYGLRPNRRGSLIFSTTQARIRSPLGLWWCNRWFSSRSRARVYPDFFVVSKTLQWIQDNQLASMGIRKFRRRSEGLDFLQLREYRQGDPIRGIDWKASARVRKLISREYQDDRDQQVVFLIDCGWSMRTQDDELPHFDHSLNALLLLAYVALRQGDAVGVGTFGGSGLWLPPAKGVASANRILNFVYELHPNNDVPDYDQAVMQLLSQQKKRALIIVITNVQDANCGELISALNTLRRHHLVLLASLREQVIDDVLQEDVDNFDDALRVAAIHEYMDHRQRALDQLGANGIVSLDVVPNALGVSLVNKYLQIKRSAAF